MKRREPRIVDPGTHPRKYVGLRVAAEFLEVDEKTVAKWLDAGLLEYHRRGACRRIAVTELVAYVERQRVKRRVG